MHTSTTRILTPARIAALALIALTAGGLGYLRFAPDAAPVSVPTGAHAGDLTLHSCTYETEDGAYPADCGTLVVPENRADPGSRLIALPVTRIKARSPHPKEPVFRLEGGPGQSNMRFSNASRLAEEHDVVLVGYRGADGSSVLDCPEVESALKHSADFLGEKSFKDYAAGFRSCATRLQSEGVDLAGYTLNQRVDDFEAARVALGYDRIDLLSESAGTRTAMIYAWRHPQSIHRSVMIAVNPPGHFLWSSKTMDEQIGHYSDLCAADDGCSRRTDDLAASMRRTAADMPDSWLFMPIQKGNARVASFYGLMESTTASELPAAATLGTWLSAAEGDPSGFWFQSLLSDLAFPTSFVWGDVAAVGRVDADYAERYFASDEHRRDSTLGTGNPGTEFVWAGGALADAWPANAAEDDYDHVRDSDVETLLIGGTLDFATPARNATKELLPHLSNGRQVVLSELGHTTDFWGYEPKASTRLINTFLASGEVDDSLYTHREMDFAPDVAQTALAKGLLGGMLGIAALAVISLLLMARRVRRRGSFGRKASALLRSVYPLILGFGGWFVGALLVMIAFPTVPLDDELLACLSAGIPIGVGIYYAWVNRDWSAVTRATGFAAALASALVGAWLGFNVTDGLLALVTTILGATVVANLTLISLDMAWDSRARDRSAVAEAGQTLEAQPSAG